MPDTTYEVHPQVVDGSPTTPRDAWHPSKQQPHEAVQFLVTYLRTGGPEKAQVPSEASVLWTVPEYHRSVKANSGSLSTRDDFSMRCFTGKRGLQKIRLRVTVKTCHCFGRHWMP